VSSQTQQQSTSTQPRAFQAALADHGVGSQDVMGIRYFKDVMRWLTNRSKDLVLLSIHREKVWSPHRRVAGHCPQAPSGKAHGIGCHVEE
jgi:hypothetical protein